MTEQPNGHRHGRPEGGGAGSETRGSKKGGTAGKAEWREGEVKDEKMGMAEAKD